MHHTVRAEDDDDGAAQAWRERIPPDNEVGGTVAVDAVVTRTDDLAVVVRFVRVHGNGMAINLALLRRSDPEPAGRHEFFRAFDSDLLLGVELADGSTATNTGGQPFPAPDSGDPRAPMLQPQGGGGGGREYAMSYFLTPLPPPGDLVVVVASVSLSLPEGRVVIPAGALAAAADRRGTLWPREPDRSPEFDAGQPPEVPAGGWFERALARER